MTTSSQPSSPGRGVGPRALGHTVRVLAALGAMIALSWVALTGAAGAHVRSCARAHTRIAAASRAEMRTAVVCLVNRQRTERGLPRLSSSGRLNRSAQGWTNEMVSHRDFSHGADFASRISAVGFDWSTVGENIAGGFRTPASVVDAWMASTGHCQNILNPVYKNVGTGLSGGASISGASGTWTEDFGVWIGRTSGSSNFGPADGCPYH
jgi:uncharacterized protein YkwD